MSENEEDRDKARAARAAADLKETEDLLAGFDRPGRTPRTPAVRDFVDFHLKRGSDPFASNKDAAAKDAAGVSQGPAALGDDKRGAPTFVLPRDPRTFPSWLAWGLAMLVMVGGAATFAWCIVSANNRDGASSSTPSTSAATTISAGSAPTGIDTTSERNIPPPPPPSTTDDPPTPAVGIPIPMTTTGPSTVVSPRPSAAGSRPSSSSSSSSPATTPTSTVAPQPSANPDFIRNL